MKYIVLLILLGCQSKSSNIDKLTDSKGRTIYNSAVDEEVCFNGAVHYAVGYQFEPKFQENGDLEECK